MLLIPIQSLIRSKGEFLEIPCSLGNAHLIGSCSMVAPWKAVCATHYTLIYVSTLELSREDRGHVLVFQVHLELEVYRHGLTRQRVHAAYYRCMRCLVDDMWSIPLTFYTEKMLIRHVLTAGAVGCENPLSSRISSHSECFVLFIYVRTLIWGLCEMLHFIRKWEKRKRSVLKRQRRGMNWGMEVMVLIFVHSYLT